MIIQTQDGRQVRLASGTTKVSPGNTMVVRGPDGSFVPVRKHAPVGVKAAGEATVKKVVGGAALSPAGKLVVKSDGGYQYVVSKPETVPNAVPGPSRAPSQTITLAQAQQMGLVNKANKIVQLQPGIQIKTEPGIAKPVPVPSSPPSQIRVMKATELAQPKQQQYKVQTSGSSGVQYIKMVSPAVQQTVRVQPQSARKEQRIMLQDGTFATVRHQVDPLKLPKIEPVCNLSSNRLHHDLNVHLLGCIPKNGCHETESRRGGVRIRGDCL